MHASVHQAAAVQLDCPMNSCCACAQPHMKRCRTAEIAGEGAAKALSEFVGARTPDQQLMQG